ncbi:MAG: TauD/TfdA family dioxygenase [Actinomycetota bacterium]
MTEWRVTPLAASLGARVDGVRLRDAGADELARLHELLDEHLVLVVTGQDDLDVAGHIRVGEAFGDPYVHPFIDAIPEHPAILQVIKEPEDHETFGGEHWHCDISFVSPPAAVSILRAVELPSIGGDTLFCNTALAHDRLSVSMQRFLAELTAVHVYPDMAETPETSAVHPVVRIHPRTGRPALYVNSAFVDRIEQLERDEGDALLGFLYAHQIRPEFQVRVSWEPGQVVLWDNRATVHYAMNDYPGQRRRLQRVTSMEVTI